MSESVQFNVGGRRFFTTRQTVAREPASKLAGLIQQPASEYFLDRDPKHFQLILNWLRDGWCAVPQSPEERKELAAEVKHYRLAGMDAWLRSQSHAESMAAATAGSPYVQGLERMGLGSATALGTPAAAAPEPTIPLHNYPLSSAAAMGTTPAAPPPTTTFALHTHQPQPHTLAASRPWNSMGPYGSGRRLSDVYGISDGVGVGAGGVGAYQNSGVGVVGGGGVSGSGLGLSSGPWSAARPASAPRGLHRLFSGTGDGGGLNSPPLPLAGNAAAHTPAAHSTPLAQPPTLSHHPHLSYQHQPGFTNSHVSGAVPTPGPQPLASLGHNPRLPLHNPTPTLSTHPHIAPPTHALNSGPNFGGFSAANHTTTHPPTPSLHPTLHPSISAPPAPFSATTPLLPSHPLHNPSHVGAAHTSFPPSHLGAHTAIASTPAPPASSLLAPSQLHFPTPTPLHQQQHQHQLSVPTPAQPLSATRTLPGSAYAGGGPLGSDLLQQQRLAQEQQLQVFGGQQPPASAASMVLAGSTPSDRRAAFRSALQRATSPPPQPGTVLSHGLPPQSEFTAASVNGGGAKWTAKYLKDPELHNVVNTLLELAFSGPHPALCAGKVVVHITPGPCEHTSGSNIVPGGLKQQLRSKLQAVRVHNLGSGWACEFPIRPGCDVTLFDKFSSLPEFVQENWFVLCAILRDQFGVLMAEESAASASSLASHPQLSASLLGAFGSGNSDSSAVTKSSSGSSSSKFAACPLCKQATLAITLHKVV